MKLCMEHLSGESMQLYTRVTKKSSRSETKLHWEKREVIYRILGHSLEFQFDNYL